MKLIYKAKWIIAAMTAVTWLIAFGVLFVGGTANINRLLLGINMLLLITFHCHLSTFRHLLGIRFFTMRLYITDACRTV